MMAIVEWHGERRGVIVACDEKKWLEDGSRKLGGKFKKKAPKILVGKNRIRI